MAKALTAKELKALKSDQVVKLAERLKIAGFTKMSRGQMESAILESQKASGKAISTDDVPTRGARDDRRPRTPAKDPPKPKPKSERDGDEVELTYIASGGKVTIGKRGYTPGLAVRMTRIEAHVIRHRFPTRFRISEVA